MPRIAVCLVGDTGSGKTTVSYIFEEKGFKRISIGDDIYNELVLKNIKINTRQQLIKFATELRENNGNSYFIAKSLQKNHQYENVVIDAVRYMQEVYTCNKMGYQTYILVIDAAQELRLARIKNRKNKFDPINDNEFYENSKIEISTISPNAIQEVIDIMRIGNCTILNNSSIYNLNAKVVDFIIKICPEVRHKPPLYTLHY